MIIIQVDLGSELRDMINNMLLLLLIIIYLLIWIQLSSYKKAAIVQNPAVGIKNKVDMLPF